MESQRRRFLAKVAKHRRLHFRHFSRLVRFYRFLSFFIAVARTSCPAFAGQSSRLKTFSRSNLVRSSVSKIVDTMSARS
jgi:hypothetical protein